MFNSKYVRRAVALLVMSLWGQTAAALSCGSFTGGDWIQPAAELFANATEKTCGSANLTPGPTKDGHIIVAQDGFIEVQFINNGAFFFPTSTSLSCTGATVNDNYGSSRTATMVSGAPYSTTCTVGYTDINGTSVSHSFTAGTFLQGTDLIGIINPFSVSSGWFEEIAPTVVLSGLSGSIGGGSQNVIAQFSEAVIDFTVTDLSLTNATVTNFTMVNTSRYTFDISPVGSGSISVQIPAASLTDLPSNDNLASNTLSATVDLTVPGVAISGLPAEISGPTVFAATITFSENVTGFVAADITVSNGAVTGFSGSGAVYTATISATGGGDLVMSIAANVAQDAVGNDNTASSVVAAVSVVASQTSALNAQFMLSRANALLANQPDLAGFLRGGAGHFNVDANDDGGIVSFDSGYDAPIWARVNANWSTNAGAESLYLFGVIGAHSRLSENFLLGGMVQFDTLNETSGVATMSGNGWLIGPYFAAKLAGQPLYFEGSLLYGQTSNEVSPFGTYTDNFTTKRWLATFGVSGLIERDAFTLTPFLDAKYTSDTQAAYVDGLSNPVGAQTIALGQIVAGLDIEIPVSAMTVLNAGLSGIWSYSSGTTVALGFEGGRARLDLGVAHNFSANSQLAVSGFYDGIGTPDYAGYGAEITFSTQF